MAYVKEASSIAVLRDAVGVVLQQHTTTTTVRELRRRVEGHLPHDILRTRPRPAYVDGAHARLRRT